MSTPSRSGCSCSLAPALLILVVLLAGTAFAQPACPEGAHHASATIILPPPGPNLQPGDVVTAEAAGTCYGIVTQADARTALPVFYDGPEDQHRDAITVRVWRGGEPVRALRTGLLARQDDVFDLTPSDSLEAVIDTLTTTSGELFDLVDQQAGQIVALSDSLAQLEAGMEDAIAAAVAEATAQLQAQLAAETQRADAAEARAAYLDGRITVWGGTLSALVREMRTRIEAGTAVE